MKVSLAPLRSLAVFIALACSCLCEAESILISPDRTNGVYQVGDHVEWRIERDAEASEARYAAKRGGWTVIDEGRLQFTGDTARLDTSFERPGTVLLEVKWKDKDGQLCKSVGGAVCAPDQIGLAVPPPDDFQEFWEAKLQELEAVPVNARLTKVEIGQPDIDCSHITMDNIHGTSIRGQIARPSKEGEFPALLIVQWAGVYPLEKGWVTTRAKEGWLTLNINAHDLPIDRPESFYRQQAEGPLRDYWSIGNDNRETSYFSECISHVIVLLSI